MISALAPVSSPSTEGRYLSWSAITAFRTCPLKYYFRYVAQLPEESVSASLVFGAAIHRAVEHHFQQLLCGAPPPSFDDLFDLYQTRWHGPDSEQVCFAASESRQSLNATAERVLKAFQSSSLARPSGTILAIEESLCGRVGTAAPPLRGT